MVTMSSAIWFSSQRECRDSTGETALSAGHVGVGSLRSQTLHWQKAGTQGLRSPPPPEPEIQRAYTQSDGYKVCDASRQVSGWCCSRMILFLSIRLGVILYNTWIHIYHVRFNFDQVIFEIWKLLRLTDMLLFYIANKWTTYIAQTKLFKGFAAVDIIQRETNFQQLFFVASTQTDCGTEWVGSYWLFLGQTGGDSLQ